mmetsp:Transcript_11703/g.11337  ORF Transcript_11703/g.11337 Transcript_11703/m.11337 type:complete len:531 (-) Transcript_11703:339-1931(-)
MSSSKSRLNGLQWPPSRDQLKTVIIYPLLSIGYYFLIYATLLGYEQIFIALICLNVALSILLVLAWVTVEYIDPQLIPGKGGIPVICFPTPEKSTRFCSACKKTISGLDHHCTWLNTCVGRRNYVSFISLVFIGAMQSILQTVVGVVSLTIWINNEEIKLRILEIFHGRMYGFFVIVGFYSAMNGLIAFGLIILACFHSYLMIYVRMGTYDWLLQRRGSRYDANVQDVEMAHDCSERERTKQKQREEWQKIMNGPRRPRSGRLLRSSSHSLGCIDTSHQISVNIGIYNGDDEFGTSIDRRKNMSRSNSSKGKNRFKSSNGSHETKSNNLHDERIDDILLHNKIAQNIMDENELGKVGIKEEIMIKNTTIKKNSIKVHPTLDRSPNSTKRKDLGFFSSSGSYKKSGSRMNSIRSQNSIGGYTPRSHGGYLELLGVLPVEKSITWSSRSDFSPSPDKPDNDIMLEDNSLSDCNEDDELSKKQLDIKSCLEDNSDKELLKLVGKSQKIELPDNHQDIELPIFDSSGETPTPPG